MATNEHPKRSMRDEVMSRISGRKLAARPKAYFTLQVIALALIASAILVSTIFIFNFIAFSIRLNGDDTLLSFGPAGWRAFVRFFPWAMLTLDAVLVVTLEWMLRRFRFAYKIPILYLLAGLVVISAAIGIGLDRGTPLNDDLFEGRDRLPSPIGRLYEGARRTHERGSGVCACTITAIDDDRTLTAIDAEHPGTTLTVRLPDDDPRIDSGEIAVGRTVLIAGEEHGSVIEAYGVGPRPHFDFDDILDQ